MKEENFKSVNPEPDGSSANSANYLHKKDKIRKRTRDKIRKLKEVKIKKDDRYVFKIEISKMQAMIATFLGEGATTLIFDLGTYQDQSDFDRYNTRNGSNWQPTDFDNSLTVIIGGDGKTVGLLNEFYDAVEMCPPPDDGSCGYPFH